MQTCLIARQHLIIVRWLDAQTKGLLSSFVLTELVGYRVSQSSVAADRYTHAQMAVKHLVRLDPYLQVKLHDVL